MTGEAKEIDDDVAYDAVNSTHPKQARNKSTRNGKKYAQHHCVALDNIKTLLFILYSVNPQKCYKSL